MGLLDGKIAVVTGAGGGLGREHALALAAEGAAIVVNDLGGARDGSGSGAAMADLVVDQIKAAGGEAVANYDNVATVEGGENILKSALDAFGQVDILINNAGILRDKSFANMTKNDFDLVLAVHLSGTANCTRAVWDHMREAGYGRIVVTTSSSGLYGNFGQANYGAAKLGVVGLMNTLSIEGAKYDIRVNALAPVAHTRMTEELLPDEAKELLKPEEVTPGVVFLVSKDAPNGMILAAGAGGYAAAKIYETEGIWVPEDERTPETIASRFDEIIDPAGQQEFGAGGEQTMKFLGKAMGAGQSS
jgi:NAD(P)-dependent dehydrogenase (short-subunit alcohol dehydrogenase family)